MLLPIVYFLYATLHKFVLFYQGLVFETDLQVLIGQEYFVSVPTCPHLSDYFVLKAVNLLLALNAFNLVLFFSINFLVKTHDVCVELILSVGSPGQLGKLFEHLNVLVLCVFKLLFAVDDAQMQNAWVNTWVDNWINMLVVLPLSRLLHDLGMHCLSHLKHDFVNSCGKLLVFQMKTLYGQTLAVWTEFNYFLDILLLAYSL